MKKIILTFLSFALIFNLIQISSLNGKFGQKKSFALQSEDFSENEICDGSDSESDEELKYFFYNNSTKHISKNISKNNKKNEDNSSNFISSISTPPPQNS